MEIEATHIKAIKKYLLQIEFNDGTTGEYDVSNLAGTQVFQSLENEETFSQVFINKENGAIAWSEEMEIDTLNAYLTIKGISFEQFLKETSKTSHAIS